MSVKEFPLTPYERVLVQNQKLRDDVERYRAALFAIARLKVEEPSPLGAPHGAGTAKGFAVATEIAQRALKLLA